MTIKANAYLIKSTKNHKIITTFNNIEAARKASKTMKNVYIAYHQYKND